MEPNLMDPSTIRPAAHAVPWRGSQLRHPSMPCCHELTHLDILELDEALRHVTSHRFDPARLRREHFPLGRLGDTLQAIARQLEVDTGFSLIRGIPVERYSLHDASVLLCGIAAHFGRLMPQNIKGEIINHVRNSGLAGPLTRQQRGYQGGSPLPFHSDSCDMSACSASATQNQAE